MAITSDCLTPGAQYSSAAEGGLPRVHRPATQRLALKWRPISFTAVNRKFFTVAWREMLGGISLTPAKILTPFLSWAPGAGRRGGRFGGPGAGGSPRFSPPRAP